MAEVLAHDGPALLDVVTERQELLDAAGDQRRTEEGLRPLRHPHLMSGRGDELLDLARANWRQLF